MKLAQILKPAQNKKRFFGGMAMAAACYAALPSTAAAQSSSIRLSYGNSYQYYNDVQIPNTDLGTRFSLFDTVGEGPVPALRFEANWKINKKHGLRMMLAPLAYTETGMLDEPVLFEGESYNANESLEATYKFNSYRIGYHYSFMDNANGFFRVGFTAKIRDAQIKLEQGDTVSSNDNIGFVPLLHIAGKYRLSNRITIGSDVDALAGGPGRAIDLGLTVDFSITDRFKIGADVRVVEGGADVEEVYNFAQFNSASIALSADF